MVSEYRAMEQDDGFGFGIGSLAEVENVSIWAEAADERRAKTVGELEFFMARKLAGRWI